MREHVARSLFTVIFSLLSTAVASVIMLLLPVLYYTGSQTEIPFVLLGFMTGALVFSITGTLMTYRIRNPTMPGLVLSFVALAASAALYKFSGPVNNLDLFIGSVSSQSFSIFFSTMYQSYPQPGIPIKAASISVATYTLLNLLLFVVTAGLYAFLNEEYLPNIIAYLELVTAIILSITLLSLIRNNHNNKGKNH